MKILVTGASGFLGKQITKIALEKGNDILGLDLLPQSSMLKCDLTNAEETYEILRGKNFDSVIHLAGIRGSYEDMTRVNVEGTSNLFNALSETPKSVVLASSCAVYGIPHDPGGCISEEDPTLPITDYGRTMLEKENISRKICTRNNIPFASARIFNLFGADQSPSMMTSAVAQKLVLIFKGKLSPPLETGPLHTIRDLVDVHDVAEAMVKMAMQKTAGDFNVGTGSPKSGTEVVNMFQKILRMDIPVNINSEFNPMVESIYADISRIQSVLDWKPSIPFHTTLEAIIEHWLKQETL